MIDSAWSVVGTHFCFHDNSCLRRETKYQSKKNRKLNYCYFPCWDVRYDIHMKTMFGSSLPPVVCSRARVLFTLFVFGCA
jgi:hypothetical protein